MVGVVEVELCCEVVDILIHAEHYAGKFIKKKSLMKFYYCILLYVIQCFSNVTLFSRDTKTTYLKGVEI